MTDNTGKHSFSIIGGGVLGLSCAYALAKAFGQNSVQIFDAQGFPAHNASYLAGGMITPYSELDHMPPAFLPAGGESIRLWAELAAQSKVDFEFAQNGSLIIAHPEDLHLLERFWNILAQTGSAAHAQKCRPAAAEPLLPLEKFAQGVYIPAEAHLNPRKAMHALCAAIDNKSSAHTTPQEQSIRAQWVIDCRGMGARSDDAALRGVKGEVLIVRNPDFKLTRPVRLMHPRYPLYIVPRADNVFLIGATIIESSENNTVSIRSGLELMSAAFSLHPSFAHAEIIEISAGIRPAYQCNMPAIFVDGNIIRANGLFRHGYLLSPVMAECIVAIVKNEIHPLSHLFLKEKSHARTDQRRANNA